VGVSTPAVPLFDVVLSEDEIAAVADTLRSGWLTMGPHTEQFEREFAAHLGVAHTVALSSGTAALHLAYRAAGLGPGDEIIVPGITFVATANAARYCGATPVLADVAAPEHLALDPEDVERRITPHTRAVCVVHYGGYAGPVTELLELCAAHGLALIEDAAHCPSATAVDDGPKLGGLGLAGAFSFFSNKVLSCGEGGLLATNDDQVAELARRLRSHGLTSGTWDRHRGHALSYDVVDLGYNYRIDEPRAALLSARLPGLEADIAARRRLVHRYRESLRDVPGLALPYRDEEVDRSSCYVMPVLLDDPELQEPLRRLMLSRWGVQTSLLYPALHEFSAFRDLNADLPRSERVARTEVTLPLYPHLSAEDQARVIEAVREGLRELAAPAGKWPVATDGG
jgi:dTDP-4-amino-4,6-dideoxygalactose transaminase